MNSRFWLLRIVVGAFVVSAILGLTPIHWYVEKTLFGVPDEYHPEFLWLGFGLPVALVLIMIGAYPAWRRRPSASKCDAR